MMHHINQTGESIFARVGFWDNWASGDSLLQGDRQAAAAVRTGPHGLWLVPQQQSLLWRLPGQRRHEASLVTYLISSPAAMSMLVDTLILWLPDALLALPQKAASFLGLSLPISALPFRPALPCPACSALLLSCPAPQLLCPALPCPAPLVLSLSCLVRQLCFISWSICLIVCMPTPLSLCVA